MKVMKEGFWMIDMILTYFKDMIDEIMSNISFD